MAIVESWNIAVISYTILVCVAFTKIGRIKPLYGMPLVYNRIANNVSTELQTHFRSHAWLMALTENYFS